LSLQNQVSKSFNKIFRRCFIKRRQNDGTYESEWQDVSKYVKKWGKIRREIDSSRLSKFRFRGMTLVMQNEEGTFNPWTNDASLWFGFSDIQRTLFKIEAGYLEQTQGADGIWINTEYPSTAEWDMGHWDSAKWDDQAIAFTGIIYGNIAISTKNEVALPIQPVTEVFRQYSARNIGGYNDSLTASKFIELVRDHTDGSSNYVFRPFFGDTTTNWEIATTTSIFANLNTSTADDVRDNTVWKVMEKLSEAENHVPFIGRDGKFIFKDRADITTTIAWEFHGQGTFNRTYGHNIIDIRNFAPKPNKYYSRVSLKWKDANTTTSFEIRESTLTVGNSTAWIFGERTFAFTNTWIQTATVAQTLAQTLFDDYSSLKQEINVIAPFTPELDILDLVSVTYDASPTLEENLWDVRDWAADNTSTSTDLIWDANTGEALKLSAEEFKIISVEDDLDKFRTIVQARET